MELDFPCDEDAYGIASPPLNTPTSSQWNSEENKLFENALAEMDPSSPTFFENVAARVPWKTVEEIKLHYQALINDVEMIESEDFLAPDYPYLHLCNESETEPEPQPQPAPEPKGKRKAKAKATARGKSRGKSGKPRRKALAWTEEEHQLFLMGLNKYGKGDWRSISRFYVITKSTTQVASHAQKFFRRRNSTTPPDRRRPSIHDIQTVTMPASTATLITQAMLRSSFAADALYGCAAPFFQQNIAFMPPPLMNSVYAPYEYPLLDQTVVAANYGYNSGLLVNPNWG